MIDEITTDRLTMRPSGPEDAEAIWAAIQDPRIYRNVGHIPPNQSLDDTRAFLAEMRERRMADQSAGFVVEREGAVIGHVGGGRNTGAGQLVGAFDVGYWIDPRHWSRGYATEAVGGLLSWLQRAKGEAVFTAGYFTDNPASGRVQQKHGFLRCSVRPYWCMGRSETVSSIETVKVV